ncbi:MAG: ATP-binding protein [Gammaproteobacteria bacterium]|jgi:two-component system sensor histidine kinase QseC
MISSIKRFLLFNLLLSIIIISLLAFIGNLFLYQRDIRKHADEHLINNAELLLSVTLSCPKFLSYSQQKDLQHKLLQCKNCGFPHTFPFQFRIWDHTGKLLVCSQRIFSTTPGDHKEGFQDIKINGRYWRFYTKNFKAANIIIQVGESYQLQKKLRKTIAFNYLEVLVVTCLLFGVLIWLIVGHGLKNIKILAQKVSRRSATALKALESKNMPTEIRPIVDELNNLFARLQKAFERNKRFAGDAAHELRTPLAALKTQAQVALLASNLEDSKKTIQKVIEGTNRCTHVVQQLLTLSRLSEEETLGDMQLLDLVALTTNMLAQLAPFALSKNIDLAFIKPKEHQKIVANETALSILIRNLVDNAIRYTPKGGDVTVKIVNMPSGIALQVIDSGPGIPPELYSQVFERFYRILGTKTSGSGLGLPIVKQIAELHNAKINLSTPKTGKGLKIEVIFKY